MDKRERGQQTRCDPANDLTTVQATWVLSHLLEDLLQDLATQLDNPRTNLREFHLNRAVSDLLNSPTGELMASAFGLSAEKLSNGLEEIISLKTTGYHNPILGARAAQARKQSSARPACPA